MKQLVFVIHKHAATRLHYDFRLQIGDTMPSWAVPKGPSLDNTVKRLAMKVPDHDLSYRNFEGNLEEGKYGAASPQRSRLRGGRGPVMIWDEGYYIPEIEVAKGARLDSARQVREAIKDYEHGQKVMLEGLEKGEIKFVLHGKKLKGSFALVKTKGFAGPNAWLLIKHNDEFVKKGYDAKDYDFSAKSGKSIEEIRTKKRLLA